MPGRYTMRTQTRNRLVMSAVASITAALGARFGVDLGWLNGVLADLVTLGLSFAATWLVTRLMPEGRDRDEIERHLDQIARAAAIGAANRLASDVVIRRMQQLDEQIAEWRDADEAEREAARMEWLHKNQTGDDTQ